MANHIANDDIMSEGNFKSLSKSSKGPKSVISMKTQSSGDKSNKNTVRSKVIRKS